MTGRTGELTLISGGTGSLGQALIPKLLAAGQRVRVLSRDEAKQGLLAPTFSPHVEWMLGDVRDLRACQKAVEGVSTVIHAASLKFVDRSEIEPTEYALTNVLGSINMLTAIREGPVSRAVGISTDKVSEASNVYGHTKALMEKFFIEAQANPSTQRYGSYVICRYGNVLGSRGSVVLKWQEARHNKQRIGVTNPDMTRFFFTMEDAVNLIDRALIYQGDDPLVLSQAMSAATLGDMADIFAPAPEAWAVIGERAGEKRHEMLLTAQERTRTFREDDGFFYYYPRSKKVLHAASSAAASAYTSDIAPRLTGEPLRRLLEPWL